MAQVSTHYGIEERKDLVAIFIAVVPVSLDGARVRAACVRRTAC
jgi:hypothetical protein